MRITFVLPTFAPRPSGGFKVVYEFANGLANRGHRVSVVHPCFASLSAKIKERLWSKFWPLAVRVALRQLPPWFNVSSQVRMLLVPDLRPAYVPDADLIVAASWQAAEVVAAYPSRKGRKCYLVQDYEHWMTASEGVRRRIEATFHPFSLRIAYSPSVIDMLARAGVPHDVYVPLAIDQTRYYLERPVEQREHGSIGFPYRPEPFKGSADAVTALSMLHAHDPAAIGASAYGPRVHRELPPWIRYLPSPSDASLRSFYNASSIFVLPSLYEGWGLPGLEAMACGAALVTTDSLGVRGYAKHGENALVVPINQPGLLAKAVEQLLLDDALRQRLARQGSIDAQRFSWDRSVTALEAALHGAASGSA